MKDGKYIVALDVGTTKICAVVGRITSDSVETVSVNTRPSAGLRKGVVVDMDAAAASIRECVKSAEETSGIAIGEAFVSISGSHIRGFKSSGAVGITEGVVKQKDIDKVMETAQTVYVPLDKEVLHIVPVEYIVDGEGEILNPIGMRGVRLEANVQIVTGSINSIQNLLKCCRMAGVEVVEVMLSPLVTAMAALREDEKKYGAVLADIGGGTMDIALFRNDTFLGTSIVDVGGNQFTNDVAVGLRLPVVEAERVKKAYGSAFITDDQAKEEVSIMVANREERKIPRSYITEIIKPRCEEVIGLLKEEIERISGYDQAPYGVVLTGGMAQLNGFVKMAESTLGMPVRLGSPEGRNVIDKVKSPVYSTAVGLLLYAHKNLVEAHFFDKLSTDLSSVKKWVFGLGGKMFKFKSRNK